MEREKIIDRLAEINRKLEKGDLCNPARIEGNRVIVLGSGEELIEVVELIGKWSAKREREQRSDILLEKTMLEAELAASFNLLPSKETKE